jgi:hypothetical protein
MPYVSDAQRRYFNVNRKKLERQGVDVDEWNDASRGKKLPERVKHAAFVDEVCKLKLGNPLLALVARHQLKPTVNEAIGTMERKALQGVDQIGEPAKFLVPQPPESWDEVMQDIRPSAASSGRTGGGMGLGRLV